MSPLTPQQNPLLSQSWPALQPDNQDWIDQYNQHLLLTVQAFQRLHTALDAKFTRSPGGL